MITEGLKLMVVGMSIVYVFLIILMGLIIITSKLFKENVPLRPSEQNIELKKNNDLITVISAAISAYRSKK